MELFYASLVYVIASVLIWVLVRPGRPTYSERLYFLNITLLILLVVLIALRYITELAQLLGDELHFISAIEIIIAPIYGAVLTLHVALNIDFFTARHKLRIKNLRFRVKKSIMRIASALWKTITVWN